MLEPPPWKRAGMKNTLACLVIDERKSVYRNSLLAII